MVPGEGRWQILEHLVDDWSSQGLEEMERAGINSPGGRVHLGKVKEHVFLWGRREPEGWMLMKLWGRGRKSRHSLLGDLDLPRKVGSNLQGKESWPFSPTSLPPSLVFIRKKSPMFCSHIWIGHLTGKGLGCGGINRKGREVKTGTSQDFWRWWRMGKCLGEGGKTVWIILYRALKENAGLGEVP